LLLWDGIRNGIVHTFSPKPFEYRRKKIRLQFYVEDRTRKAHAAKINSTVLIRINAFELYEFLKKAIEKYRKELKTDANLQDNFILAWSSIEEYSRNINSDTEKSNEANFLLSELKKTNNRLSLWEAKLGGK